MVALAALGVSLWLYLSHPLSGSQTGVKPPAVTAPQPETQTPPQNNASGQTQAEG